MTHEYKFPVFSQSGLPADPAIEKAFEFALSQLGKALAIAEKNLEEMSAQLDQSQSHVDEMQRDRETTVADNLAAAMQQLAGQGQHRPEEEIRAILEQQFEHHLDGHLQEMQAARARIDDARKTNQELVDNLPTRPIFLLENCQQASNELVIASLGGYTVSSISSFWEMHEALGTENPGISKTIAEFTGIISGDKDISTATPDAVRLATYAMKRWLEEELKSLDTPPTGTDDDEQMLELPDGRTVSLSSALGAEASGLDEERATKLAKDILVMHGIEPAIAGILISLFNKTCEVSKLPHRIEPDENGAPALLESKPAAPAEAFDTAAAPPATAGSGADPKKVSARDWLRKPRGGPSNG